MFYSGTIVSICWIIFAIIWLVSAFGAKRNLHVSWWRSGWLRVILIICVYLFLRQEIYASFWTSHIREISLTTNPVVGGIGALLCIIGIGLAIWARLHIGTNWGMPMSLKENRELVTSGPYHYIRHPIYAGVMLALVGSALVVSPWLLLVFILYFLYFIYSATSEEKTLTKEFPEEYAAYKKHTKMLIPFIL
jgi:protein-S-isoprenylcysteine O-methyltransferase Ste14